MERVGYFYTFIVQVAARRRDGEGVWRHFIITNCCNPLNYNHETVLTPIF